MNDTCKNTNVHVRIRTRIACSQIYCLIRLPCMQEKTVENRLTTRRCMQVQCINNINHYYSAQQQFTIYEQHC